MFDAMVAMADAGVNYWSMGLYGGATAPLINHSFRASDGFFIIQCARRHQFEGLARTIGHEEWLDDPRIPDAPSWFEHLDDVIRPGIEGWACNLSREDASRALAEAGVAAGPVNRAGDVIQNRHIRDHNMIVSMPRTDDENLGPVLTIGNPVKLSKMAEGPETRVPYVGEHTDEVLREELDLTDAELAELRAEGAIGYARAIARASSLEPLGGLRHAAVEIFDRYVPRTCGGARLVHLPPNWGHVVAVEGGRGDQLLEVAVVPPGDLQLLGPAEVQLHVALDGEAHAAVDLVAHRGDVAERLAREQLGHRARAGRSSGRWRVAHAASCTRIVPPSTAVDASAR